jgi:hypothetical protein
VEVAAGSVGMLPFDVLTKRLRVARKQCGGRNDDGREQASVHFFELWYSWVFCLVLYFVFEDCLKESESTI